MTSNLLAQFITEARDLLEQASGGLLALEKAPGDAELVNTVFRSVHTLKGASGLFEILPLTRTVHAGEDLLGAVRAGDIALQAEIVDLLLDSLDQVGRWLDALESDSCLPDDAAGVGDAQSARLRAWVGDKKDGGTAAAAAAESAEIDAAWLDDVAESALLSALTAALERGEPLSAVTYRPDANCFFSGEDPLLLARGIPGVLIAVARPAEPWPEPAALDPFICNLEIGVVATASADGLRYLFRYVEDQATIGGVSAHRLARPRGRPGDGPVYHDFAADAADLLAAGDFDSLRRAAETLLRLGSADLQPASALRFLLTALAATVDKGLAAPPWLGALIASVGSGEAPDWGAAPPVQPPPPAPPLPAAAVPPSSAPPPAQAALIADSDAASALRVLKAQIAVLDQPCPPEVWEGRFESVARVARNALSYAAMADALIRLDSAAAAAAQARSFEPLRSFLIGLTGAPAQPAAAASRAAAPTVPAASGAGHPAGHPAAHPPAAAAAVEDLNADARSAMRVLRVDQARVDEMMALIGELIVAKNSLPYLAGRAENVFGCRDLAREIKDQYGVVNRIAQDLQGAIMAVRMLPVGQVFQRFPRLVRDLSRKLGKTIDLAVTGEETEADKNVIENLVDPLVHMVRNAIDHGVESPEERIAAGKPAVGVIRLAAHQENDRVVIEVSDDGRGIDPAAIRRKAVAKGLVDDARAEQMSDQEAIDLVFAPGFSTKEVVSDLSGRGVGMDVVRTAVAKAGGSVTLTSALGKGSTVRLSLPLSMAVTRIMTIDAAGRLFGVPMDIIVETVRIRRDRIHVVKDAEAFVLRDNIIPLARLARLLGVETHQEPPEEEAVMVVLLGGERLGIVVDGFRERMEVIVKPMDGVLAGLHGYAGTALLGDGRVLLVLDVKELL